MDWKRRTKIEPAAKKGPKGIGSLIPFLETRIRIPPIAAPKKQAKKIAVKTYGIPKNNPNATTSLTSPKPIALGEKTDIEKNIMLIIKAPKNPLIKKGIWVTKELIKLKNIKGNTKALGNLKV